MTAFTKNYHLASKRLLTAIDEIDNSIDHLQKTKEALLATDLNPRQAKTGSASDARWSGQYFYI